MPFYCFAQKENVFISEFTPKPSKYMFCYMQLIPKREIWGERPKVIWNGDKIQHREPSCGMMPHVKEVENEILCCLPSYSQVKMFITTSSHDTSCSK